MSPMPGIYPWMPMKSALEDGSRSRLETSLNKMWVLKHQPPIWGPTPGMDNKESQVATVPSWVSSGWMSTEAGAIGELMALLPSSCKSVTVEKRDPVIIQRAQRKVPCFQHVASMHIPSWWVVQRIRGKHSQPRTRAVVLCIKQFLIPSKPLWNV